MKVSSRCGGNLEYKSNIYEENKIKTHVQPLTFRIPVTEDSDNFSACK